jgi:hypothetical protein
MGALEPIVPGGQAVVQTVCDSLMAKGVPIPRAHLGMIGRHARTLLEDGFEFETVVTAALLALRRGTPQHMGEMARTGVRLSRRDYERALEDEVEIRRRERR